MPQAGKARCAPGAIQLAPGTRTIVVLSRPPKQHAPGFYTIRQPQGLGAGAKFPAVAQVTLGKRAHTQQSAPAAPVSPAPSNVSSCGSSLSGASSMRPGMLMDAWHSDQFDAPARKRERLTHLTSEEKLYRRKLKNRMAAQTARDRKKLLMVDMERSLAQLERQNSTLDGQNVQLRQHNHTLEDENKRLRAELEQLRKAKQQESAQMSSSSGVRPTAFESAALISVPQQREQAPGALPLVATLCALLLSVARSSKTTNCRGYWTSSWQAPLSLTSVLHRLEGLSPSSLTALVERMPETEQQRLVSLLSRRLSDKLPPDRPPLQVVQKAARALAH